MKVPEILGKEIELKDVRGDMHRGVIAIWGQHGLAIKREKTTKLRHFFWSSIVWFDIERGKKGEGD